MKSDITIISKYIGLQFHTGFWRDLACLHSWLLLLPNVFSRVQVRWPGWPLHSWDALLLQEFCHQSCVTSHVGSCRHSLARNLAHCTNIRLHNWSQDFITIHLACQAAIFNYDKLRPLPCTYGDASPYHDWWSANTLMLYNILRQISLPGRCLTLLRLSRKFTQNRNSSVKTCQFECSRKRHPHSWSSGQLHKASHYRTFWTCFRLWKWHFEMSPLRLQMHAESYLAVSQWPC